MNRTSFRTISTNGTLVSYDRRSYDPSVEKNNNYKAGVDLYLNNQNELGIIYTGSSNRWQRDASGPTYLLEASGKVDSLVQNRNVTIEPNRTNALNLNYKLQLDTSGKQVTADADYAKYSSNSSGSLGNNLFSSAGIALGPYQELAFQQPSNITIRSVKLDAVLPFGKTSWKAGAKYAFVTSDNNFVYDSLINGNYVYSEALSNHFIYEEKIYAAYASINRKLSNTFSIDAGGRLEHTKSKGTSLTSKLITDNTYTNLFPFISLTKNLQSNNSLTLSLTRRINRPVYANLNPSRFFFDKYSYVEGNPYLKPELSWNSAIAYSFKKDFIATLSYSHTNNAILSFATQDSTTGILRISTYNYSNKDAANVLLLLPVKLTTFWNVQNTIDLSYTSYLYKQGKADYHPRRVSIDIQTVHIFTLPHSFAAEVSAQYTSPTLGGIYLLKRFFRIDCGFKKTLWKNKLDIKSSITDLLKTDRYWAYSVYGATSVRYDHHFDSRRIKLAFTYHFGGTLAGKDRRLDEQDRL
jgi:hypothetical protein